MLRPGKVSGEDYSPQERGARNANNSSQPQGQIKKISQEGGKNTYVIIVNKDCIKSQSSKGPPVLRHQPAVDHSHASLENHPILQAFSDQKKKFTDNSERDFESPLSHPSEARHKLFQPPEDVKLNLSAINDDDYDSNFSSQNVFLKPEGSSSAHDSAIEVDLPDRTSRCRTFIDEKTKMKTYVIPSPLCYPQQHKREPVRQHSFPVISQQCVGQRQSKLAKSSPLSYENTQNAPASRKIFLVTPQPSSTHSGSVLQKSVAYTNEAVPVMGKSKLHSAQQASQLPVTNPKAVPTFKNVSPITSPSSTFVPINPAASPSLHSAGIGPLTSTPIATEPVNQRLQQLRQESVSHRPVYVNQSPFTRNSSNVGDSLSTQSPDSDVNSPAPVVAFQPQTVPSHNNSSGFISASSSLEIPDSSSSFDDAKPSVDQEKDMKGMIEISGEEMKFLSHRSVTVSDDGLGGVVITSVTESDDTDMDKDLGLEFDSETDPSLTSSQESEASDVSEKVSLNRSLTNIQWLKGMQLKEERPQTQTQPHQWKTLTPEEIKRISAECGKDKRPPFSYMAMIQMALYSREDRRMMLKEICKWIEDTFPYYKYTAKPGWKNSIRHNLSLYNIFEREPAKRHGSYWTIKPDMEPRTKQYKDRHSGSSSASHESHRSSPSLPGQTAGGMIPIIPMYSSMGQLSAITPQPVCMPQQTQGSKKKGPPPILPRPSPYSAPQTYALIPISGISPGVSMPCQPGQQQVIVGLSNPGSQASSACPSPGISEMSAAVASIQMSCPSPIPQEQLESNINKEHIYTKKPPHNIVKQAWLDCQSMDTASSVDSDLASSNDIASSSELSGTRSKSKRPRDKPGLPKPVMYSTNSDKRTKLTGSKRRKLQQKERELLNESSDEEDEGTKFISNLEKEIDMLTTSTPLKTASPTASQLPSPIPGLTPLRHNNLFDGSFIDTLDKKDPCLSLEGFDCKKSSGDGSPPFNDSPNISLLDLNELPFVKLQGSPDSNSSLSNQNLSKILLDYGLEPGNIDNQESFPNFNWSMVQTMVDNMDTSEKP